MYRMQEINALAWAADKTGLSYGKLVLTLNPLEREKILQEYGEYLAEKERRAARIITKVREKIEEPESVFDDNTASQTDDGI